MQYTSNDLKTIRKAANLTQQQFAQNIDLARETIVRMEAGTVTISKAVELYLNELKRDNLSHKGQLKKNISIENHGVPYYNTPATAGAIAVFSEVHNHIPAGHINIPNMPKCDGAVPIVGDSMYPLLKSGDTVLYKIIQDKSKIIWGEMYIAMIIHEGDEYFFIKYINKSENEGYARFVSYNDHHQPVEFPMDSIKALAIVKASIRINTSI